MPRPSKRDRGRFLTETGLQKLRDGIHTWEQQQELRCTDERLGGLAQVDATTVGKIRRAKGKADLSSIQSLFQALTLTLEDSDHGATAPVSAPKSDPNFVGREGAIADLDQWVSRGTKIIVIQAKGGVGKTTLARRYLQQRFDRTLEFPIAKETKDIAAIEALLEEKLRQLEEEPGREFFVSLDRLKRKLQTEAIGILIDNLEPALDEAGRFIQPHRRYVELLRVLEDPSLQSLTLITSRERLRESCLTTLHYTLEGLALTAWQQFFQSRNLNPETPCLAELHRAYGGNAKAMEILCGAIREDFAGDIDAYWQANQDDLLIEQDLKDLVEQQFERLQRLNPDAYQLLCRMGCYRYQDVPRVPMEGLFCLLWDVPEPRHRRVIKTLQDRSLIDFENHEFWLHPIIRAVSIFHLRDHEDWEISNRKAAEFWAETVEEIVNIEDALKLLEAYHHYFCIQDYDSCGRVLMEDKKTDSPYEREQLAGSFYRLGLLNNSVTTILKIKDLVQDSYSVAGLNLILGYSYNLMGYIREAIDCHLISRTLALNCLNSFPSVDLKNSFHDKLTRINILSYINVGLCKLDLWQIASAICLFEEALNISKQFDYKEIMIVSSCLIALATSYEKNNDLAQKFIGETRENLSEDLLIDKSKDVWNRAYIPLYLGIAYKNLDELDKATDSLNRAIATANSTQYVQAIAKALTGLAEIDRKYSRFSLAIPKHLESIEILRKISARCDLAEAYFQCGLTYQAMGEMAQAVEFRDRALQLFREMEAPRQVERVTKAFNA